MKTNFLQNYFTFSRSERVGLITLLVLIILILIIPKLLFQNHKPELVQDSLYKLEVEEFIKSYRNENNDLGHNYTDFADDSKFHKKGSRYSPFEFDPNFASSSDYIRMGFSERQAAVLVKYRDRGGKFHQKEDFNKLYIIDDETYKIFEPYIRITDSDNKPITQIHSPSDYDPNKNLITEISPSNASPKSFSQVIVELNSADSMNLLSVKGIGPVFASRILKYRKRLGGFYHIDQIREVYGIDSTRFEGISPQILTDTTLIEKINLNTATLEQLRKHPYFDYATAKAVIDKRIQVGSYQSMSEVKPILEKKGRYNTLYHYLKVE